VRRAAAGDEGKIERRDGMLRGCGVEMHVGTVSFEKSDNGLAV
jgi:hypothetical protein